MGTTVIAIQTIDGVMIGADTQTSAGALISNKTSDKMNYLTKSIICCRSGSAADTQNSIEHIRIEILQNLIEWKLSSTVRTIAQFLRDFCYQQKRLSAGFICAGWDSFHGGQIYSITQGGCIFLQPIVLMGSGSVFVQGFCDANFNPLMSKHESLIFLTKALSLAIFRDSSSGGIIRLANITKNGIERMIVNPLKPVHKIGIMKPAKFILV